MDLLTILKTGKLEKLPMLPIKRKRKAEKEKPIYFTAKIKTGARGQALFNVGSDFLLACLI